MPVTGAKNLPLGGAVTDLGLGDALSQQLQDETEEQKRRRQLLEQMQQAVNPLGAAAALGVRGGAGGIR